MAYIDIIFDNVRSATLKCLTFRRIATFSDTLQYLCITASLLLVLVF
jgi:hypothetical protein